MGELVKVTQTIVGFLFIMAFFAFITLLFMNGAENVSIFFSMLLSPFFFVPLAFLVLFGIGIFIIIQSARDHPVF